MTSQSGVLGEGVVSADVSEQQLAVRTRILTLSAWKRLPCVVTASMKVQTLLLDTDRETPPITMATTLTTVTMTTTAVDKEVCVSGVLPAVVTVLTPVRFLLTVSSAVSEQRAAIYGGIRTLSTPVRFLTCQHTAHTVI